jgi:hypothetical protein
MVELNTYVIKLSLNFGITSTYNTNDLIIYKLQHLIHDDPFDIPTLLYL